jgi:hypothetical protein
MATALDNLKEIYNALGGGHMCDTVPRGYISTISGDKGES